MKNKLMNEQINKNVFPFCLRELNCAQGVSYCLKASVHSECQKRLVPPASVSLSISQILRVSWLGSKCGPQTPWLLMAWHGVHVDWQHPISWEHCSGPKPMFWYFLSPSFCSSSLQSTPSALSLSSSFMQSPEKETYKPTLLPKTRHHRQHPHVTSNTDA